MAGVEADDSTARFVSIEVIPVGSLHAQLEEVGSSDPYMVSGLDITPKALLRPKSQRISSSQTGRTNYPASQSVANEDVSGQSHEKHCDVGDGQGKDPHRTLCCRIATQVHDADGEPDTQYHR